MSSIEAADRSAPLAGEQEETPVYRRRTSCRSCGSESLRVFLSFGPVPLANSFLRDHTEFAGEGRFPLEAQFCENCSLVQIADVIDPEVLFRDYIYTTGVSDTMAAHNTRYAKAVTDLLCLGADNLVVEVASNDGSLLKRFQKHGVRTLGVEPAANVAEVARSEGVETVERFFNSATADDVCESHEPASAVIANNVLAHVDDPRDFLRGARRLLRDDGLLIVEVPYVRDLLARLEYDTIYHEHLCYFSVRTLRDLCDSVGLSVVRVERVPVHGGSLRICAARQESRWEIDSEIDALIEEEDALGMGEFRRYERFASDVEAHRAALLDCLSKLRDQGYSLAAYGAPAKSTTLLAYCGIDQTLLPYTVDRSALKVGLFTPGGHIPVLPVETLAERKPDYALMLAWNFAEEILAQQEQYRRGGGRFIIPLPAPEVVR